MKWKLSKHSITIEWIHFEDMSAYNISGKPQNICNVLSHKLVHSGRTERWWYQDLMDSTDIQINVMQDLKVAYFKPLKVTQVCNDRCGSF